MIVPNEDETLSLNKLKPLSLTIHVDVANEVDTASLNNLKLLNPTIHYCYP
jgi:hypothetical protein